MSNDLVIRNWKTITRIMIVVIVVNSLLQHKPVKYWMFVRCGILVEMIWILLMWFPFDVD